MPPISAPWRGAIAALWLCTSGCVEFTQTALVLTNAVLRTREADSVGQEAQQVVVISTRSARDAAGRPALLVQLSNGSRLDVVQVQMRVTYFRGRAVLARDEACTARVALRPGQSTNALCALSTVPGASTFRVEVRSVRFR